MQSFTLYIGSNNITGELELAKITAVLSRRHKGFTITQATGYWLGKREQTAVVTLHDKPDLAMATIADLKRELHQDAIAYQVAPLQFLQGDKQASKFQTLVSLTAANVDNHFRKILLANHPNRLTRKTKGGTRRNGLPAIAIMLLGVIVTFLFWGHYIERCSIDSHIKYFPSMQQP